MIQLANLLVNFFSSQFRFDWKSVLLTPVLPGIDEFYQQFSLLLLDVKVWMDCFKKSIDAILVWVPVICLRPIL